MAILSHNSFQHLYDKMAVVAMGVKVMIFETSEPHNETKLDSTHEYICERDDHNN